MTSSSIPNKFSSILLAFIAILTFSACECDPARIAGSYTWTQYGSAASLQDVIIPSTVSPTTFRFTTNSFDGFTGCTTQSGQFSANSSCDFNISQQASSIGGPCQGNTQNLDNEFSRIISEVHEYSIYTSSGRLTLLTPSGEMLIFSRNTP